MGEENVEITTEATNVTVDEVKSVIQQPQSITMGGVATTACNALITAAAGMMLNVVGSALVAGTHKVVGAAGSWLQNKKQARKERKALKALQELDEITGPEDGDAEE